MSIDFYNQNATLFFDGTKDVNMDHLWSRFLKYLPQNAHILDAGCGSGRDSKYFKSQGHAVTAFDASAPLAQLASDFIGLPVTVATFSTFDTKERFDGIWACASLLHVPSGELAETFKKMSQWLKPNGVLYCSFKYGNEDSAKDGRNFTNCDEDRLTAFIKGSNLTVKERWVTADARPGRENEKWLNGILGKFD